MSRRVTRKIPKGFTLASLSLIWMCKLTNAGFPRPPAVSRCAVRGSLMISHRLPRVNNRVVYSWSCMRTKTNVSGPIYTDTINFIPNTKDNEVGIWGFSINNNRYFLLRLWSPETRCHSKKRTRYKIVPWCFLADVNPSLWALWLEILKLIWKGKLRKDIALALRWWFRHITEIIFHIREVSGSSIIYAWSQGWYWRFLFKNSWSFPWSVQVAGNNLLTPLYSILPKLLISLSETYEYFLDSTSEFGSLEISLLHHVLLQILDLRSWSWFGSNNYLISFSTVICCSIRRRDPNSHVITLISQSLFSHALREP